MLALIENLTKAELVTQLKDGLVLLVLGIGTVFLFLVLLIFATKLMSKVCAKINKSAPAAAKTGSTPSAQAKSVTPQSASDDAAIAIAIAAAYDKSSV